VAEGKDRQEVLQNIVQEEPRKPRAWDRSIPNDLETIVLKALAKNPGERFATAQELADDLRRFPHGQPIRAQRPALRKRVGRWCRRHRLLVTGLVALLLGTLLLGGACWWWLRKHEAAAEQARERRRAATEHAVTTDLQEAEFWQKQERWAEALQ